MKSTKDNKFIRISKYIIATLLLIIITMTTCGMSNEIIQENKEMDKISNSPATRFGVIEEVYEVYDINDISETTTCKFKINNQTMILAGYICYGVSGGTTLLYRDYNSFLFGNFRQWSLEFNESDFQNYLDYKLNGSILK